MSGLEQEQTNWRTAEFRQNVVQKIEEAIQKSGMPTAKNSVEMENHVFQKAKNKEEYLGFVARLILHVREMSTGNQGGSGGGNMMGLGPSQGPPGVTATNLLQTLNTRPQLQKPLPPGVGQLQQLGMGGPMQGGMASMQNQLGGPMQNQMGGPIPNQMGGPMQNQMGGAMQNQMGGAMQNQMGGLMQNQMGGPMQNQMGGGPMPNQMGGPMQNQMAGPIPSQMGGPNQMGGPMQNQMGGPIPSQMGGPGPIQNQMGGPMQNQMSGPIQNQMGGQMQNQMAGPIPSQIGGSMQNQMPGPIPSQMGGPNQMGGPMQSQMGGPIPNQLGGPSQNTMGSNMGPIPSQMGPMGPGGQMGSPMSAQMSRMVQNNAPNRVMNNQFIRQTPTPPQQSPVGLQHGNQMVASPALVPSPSPAAPIGMQRSVGMAPSPSGSLNTPGQAQPLSSPCNVAEDQVYRDKIRQLSKYIEPLRRMIARTAATDDVEKTNKMKKLLEILQSPNKRMPLETLLKCEHVLEKLDFKHSTLLRDHHPLLEAVSGALQSPNANHTLQRTFGPCLEILSGPPIKDLPQAFNRRRPEEPADDVPEVLQGEIARLDQRFKVSLDPTQQAGSKSIQLLCWLDDKHLPCVPPIQVSIPEDYPSHPPRCTMGHEHSTTPFLTAVKNSLESRVQKLPLKYSVSQLLDTWEMSVRQACAPSLVSLQSTTMGLLLGL